MCGDELANKYDVFRCDDSAPVSPFDWHLGISLPESKPERKSFFYELTLRHTGAASVSGLPAARSNCAWWACSVLAGVAPVGRHLKRPFDNRFVAIQNPCESYARIRMDFPLRLRKIKRQPEKGSASSFSRQSWARESMPFL